MTPLKLACLIRAYLFRGAQDAEGYRLAVTNAAAYLQLETASIEQEDEDRVVARLVCAYAARAL